VEVLKADSSLDLGASGEEKDASDPCPGNEQNHNRDKHRHAFESRSAALLVGEIVGVGVAVRNGRTARANCLAAAPCSDSGDRWRMPDLPCCQVARPRNTRQSHRRPGDRFELLLNQFYRIPRVTLMRTAKEIAGPLGLACPLNG